MRTRHEQELRQYEYSIGFSSPPADVDIAQEEEDGEEERSILVVMTLVFSMFIILLESQDNNLFFAWSTPLNWVVLTTAFHKNLML